MVFHIFVAFKKHFQFQDEDENIGNENHQEEDEVSVDIIWMNNCQFWLFQEQNFSLSSSQNNSPTTAEQKVRMGQFFLYFFQSVDHF